MHCVMRIGTGVWWSNGALSQSYKHPNIKIKYLPAYIYVPTQLNITVLVYTYSQSSAAIKCDSAAGAICMIVHVHVHVYIQCIYMYMKKLSHGGYCLYPSITHLPWP